jgi:DNA-binding winged helix-turn-helix (wHTH) protein
MLRFSFGPFLLDCEARTFLRDGKPVAVTAKAFDTLLFLVQRRGTLVEKDELLAVIWRGAAVEEANLTNSIYAVRKVLGDSPRDARFIATISGRGYQFVADVTETQETSDQAVSGYQDQIQSHSPIPIQLKRATWPGLIAATLGLAALLALVSGYYEPSPTPTLTRPVQVTNDGLPKNELVTDGSRVFYASPAPGNLRSWRLLEAPAGGGPSQPVALHNGDMSPVALSSDRNQLLIESSLVRQSNDGWRNPDRLWVQRLQGGLPSS